MNQVIAKIKTKEYVLLGQFTIFLSLAIFAPFLNNQLITGTIVNSLLIASVFVFGIGGASLLAFLPSSVSLFLGLLPMAMAPMIPFIILSNLILIGAVNILKSKNYLTAGIFGAVAKAGFLYVVSFILFNYFLTGTGAKIASSMMGYMQLLTALMGVILAYPLVKMIKK